MQNPSLNNNRLARRFSMQNNKKSDFFHSSGYGTAQNGSNIGTSASGFSVKERKEFEERRKYIKKYNNSQIFSDTYSLRHAQSYVPRTEGGAGALMNSNNSTSRSSGSYNSTNSHNSANSYGSNAQNSSSARTTSSEVRRNYLNTGQTSGSEAPKNRPSYNPTQGTNSFMNRQTGGARGAGAGARGAIGFGGRK